MQDTRGRCLGYLASCVYVPLNDPEVQGSSVAPDVEPQPSRSLHRFNADKRKRIAYPVAAKNPVDHRFLVRVVPDAEVKRTPLDRQLSAESVAPHPAAGLGSVVRARDRPVQVAKRNVELERQLHTALTSFLSPRLCAALVLVFAKCEVPLHLFGKTEADGSGSWRHRRRLSIRCSAKRSPSAAMVKLGFAPTGPGITEPSAT